MEEFAYDKRYRNTRYTGSLPPVIFLAGIAFLWIYSMTEDGDMIRFKWWMPVFSITLVIWAFYGFSRAIAVSKFRVRLIEDGIEAGGKKILWSEVNNVTFKTAMGEQAGAEISSKNGRKLEIPAAIESFAYIKGVIESKVCLPYD